MVTGLPVDMARCEPVACKQSAQCARANDWPTGDDVELTVVDGSICLNKRDDWCPMFIDRRGVELLQGVLS